MRERTGSLGEAESSPGRHAATAGRMEPGRPRKDRSAAVAPRGALHHLARPAAGFRPPATGRRAAVRARWRSHEVTQVGPAPHGAVNAVMLVGTAVAAGISYMGVLALTPRLPHAVGALPVLYAFAIAGCTVATYLIAIRARAQDDERLRWMAWGYAIAGAAMALQILGFPTISPSGGPLGTTSSGAAALYLLWHTVVPIFALLAVAHRHLPRWVRPAAVTAALGSTAYVSYGPAPLPAYFTAEGRYAPVLVETIAALAAVSLLATVVWAGAAGRRPMWATAWTTVSLAFSTWDLVLHAFAEERFTVFWWASLSMRMAQFVVLAAGLLAGFVWLFRALEAHSTALSERLDREAERARAEHGERMRRQVAVTEANERIRAVLEDRRALGMAFQPIVNLGSGRVVGVEALARFSVQPTRPPNVWFEEAASVGLGLDLELAAISAATARLDELPEGLYLALNISPEAVISARLHDCLEGVPLHRLVLEITEHAPVGNYDRLSLALDPLRAGGCKVAIDDAGAGYASFRHILRLAPDLIKLDMSLTQDIERDPVKLALAVPGRHVGDSRATGGRPPSALWRRAVL
jgi:EAL domain-containing protein (putative c-di-GMP-specific phosphodiesterase class I)